MKYTVHAYLRLPGGRVARDLGVTDILINGPLTLSAVAEFSHLGKSRFGTIDGLERHSVAGKIPTVHIVQGLGK